MVTESTKCYNFFKAGVACAFEVRQQSGARINYPNFCVIQSKWGISLDQTDHILDMLANYFLRSATSCKVDTILRIEVESYNNITSIPLELKKKNTHTKHIRFLFIWLLHIFETWAFGPICSPYFSVTLRPFITAYRGATPPPQIVILLSPTFRKVAPLINSGSMPLTNLRDTYPTTGIKPEATCP